jgi:voltage-gated sodium channel
MFQIFTVEGWHEIPDAIAAGATDSWAALARIYFGLAVLVGGILGLSLGNAVFVDQMVADNTDTLEGRVDQLTDEIHILHNEILALKALLHRRVDSPPE